MFLVDVKMFRKSCFMAVLCVKWSLISIIIPITPFVCGWHWTENENKLSKTLIVTYFFNLVCATALRIDIRVKIIANERVILWALPRYLTGSAYDVPLTIVSALEVTLDWWILIITYLPIIGNKYSCCYYNCPIKCKRRTKPHRHNSNCNLIQIVNIFERNTSEYSDRTERRNQLHHFEHGNFSRGWQHHGPIGDIVGNNQTWLQSNENWLKDDYNMQNILQ